MTTPLTPRAMLEAVRAKIVEANPLDPRHPSCKGHHLMGFKHQPKNQVCIFCGYSPGEYPGSLASVLLAVLQANPANRTRVCLESSGQFFNKLTNMLGVYWDLHHDNIDDQSKETTAFLHSLLCQ